MMGGTGMDSAMLDIFAQNGIGGEAIIWLIIAFFWVVAQLFSRAKEKARAREMDQEPMAEQSQLPEEQERSFETEMRRFLENIGAEPADVEEQDEPVPAPSRQPTRSRRPLRRPDRQVEREAARRREPAQAVAPPPLPSRPSAADQLESRLGDMDTSIDESALDLEQAYALRETRDHGAHAFMDPRTLLVNLNYLRMNMDIIPITGLSATSEERRRPTIKGRQALRNAVTSQLILSNPLAMGEDKGSYTKRLV